MAALCEMYHERPGRRKSWRAISIAGRVQNILPGMNAAFVDIGLEKNAFLYAGDIPSDSAGDCAIGRKLEQARIERMLRPGQMILVQVTKEPGGSEGRRALSCHMTLPGRLLRAAAARCATRAYPDKIER